MGVLLSDLATSRSNNFNLIRFLAASLVIYSHSFILALGTNEDAPLLKIIGFPIGTLCVDVFFVSSGFLIAGSFMNSKSIFSYILARVLRIYPALIIVLLLTTFVMGPLVTTNSLDKYFSNIEIYIHFIRNSLIVLGMEFKLPGVFESLPYPGTINGSLWTLPVELRMYILIALTLLVASRIEGVFGTIKQKYIVAILAIASVILNIYFTVFSSENQKFIHLFSMFFVGSAIYLWRDKVRLSNLGFAITVVCLAVSSLSKELFFFVYSVALPYAIFYLAYIPKGKILRFNEIGDYSYGIYIYAFPIQQLIVKFNPSASVMEVTVYAFLLSLTAAFLSWHLIEKKSLNLKKYVEQFRENRVRKWTLKAKSSRAV